MAQDNSVASGKLPYRTKTVVLAAGATADIPGNIKFLTLISATALDKVQISFNGSSFSAFPPGFNLRDFEAEIFWLKNTDVAPNTIVVAIGQADLRDSRVVIDAANPLPVTIASGSVNATIVGATFEGSDSDAEAVKATGVLSAEGYGKVFNGTTWDRMRGSVLGTWVQGSVANGSAIGSTNPVIVGGYDGTNARRISVDTSGRVNDNVQQWGGTNVLTGGVNGSVGIGGLTAHDAAITGQSVRLGGRALSSSYTTVASGDHADLITTLQGHLVVKDYTIPENHLSAAITVTNNADNAVFASAGAGLKNYLTSLTLQNTNGTAPGIVSIRDGTTVRWSVNLPASMTTPLHFTFPTSPTTTAATALNIIAATTGANILVSATGYKAA